MHQPQRKAGVRNGDNNYACRCAQQRALHQMIGDAVAPPTRCLPSFYAYSTGAQAIVQEIAAHPSPVRSDANRIQTALGLFTTLVSSLQLARAVTDPALSDQVLATGVRNALRVLDDWE
jgi:hypothetical protein